MYDSSDDEESCTQVPKLDAIKSPIGPKMADQVVRVALAFQSLVSATHQMLQCHTKPILLENNINLLSMQAARALVDNITVKTLQMKDVCISPTFLIIGLLHYIH